jgi:hypothetical protein
MWEASKGGDRGHGDDDGLAGWRAGGLQLRDSVQADGARSVPARATLISRFQVTSGYPTLPTLAM